MARLLLRKYGIHRSLVWICTLPTLLYVCCGTEVQSSNGDAMLAIKSKIFRNESLSANLRGWNASIPYCNWEGVICNSEGAVIYISLRVFLGGSISEDVGRLTGLQVFRLRWCSLGGRFPKSISKLENLRELDLSGNNLSGSIPKLEGLTKLILLSLRSNELTGPIPSLKGLVNLRVLDLSGNILTGEIPSSDWEHSRLEILDLSLNKLKGSIPATINKQRSLKTLDISYNFLREKIPCMENLTNLQELFLESNELEGNIPSMKRLSNLTRLSLANNYLIGDIPEWDWENSVISLIDLQRNSLSGSIPDAITKLSRLRVLELSSNRIQGTLPNLVQFANISSVQVSENDLTGEISGWDWNGGGHWENMRLNSLDLSRNQLRGSIPGQLLSTVRYLSLSFNSFQELNMSAYVDAHDAGNFRYGRDAAVFLLDLSNNELELQREVSSTFPGQFFGGLEFPELKYLWLDENRLSGHISLYMFDLFDGDSYGKFPNLWELNCSGNNMSGDLLLRSGLGTSGQELEMLDLSRNPNLKLSDDYSGDLSFLQTLLLGRRFPFLKEIRLSKINRTGLLPLRVGYMQALNVLDLSYSDLGGVMADAYNNDTLRSLVHLDLSHNRLTGAIPENLTKIESLLRLNLSFNQFSGHLPTFLAHDGSRRYRFNASSFIGNEGLCGEPLQPCLIADCISRHLILILEVVGASAMVASSCVILVWRWTVYSKRHRQEESR